MSDITDIANWTDAQLVEDENDGDEVFDAKATERRRRMKARKAEEERKRAEEQEARRMAEEAARQVSTDVVSEWSELTKVRRR
jgi:hypothetical protein